MKTKKKALTLALCAVLLVGATFLGTLAYLTDDDAVTNTFTVGQVHIDLNETDVDKDSNTKANKYHLLPGHTYVKDPTVTVLEDSEECYVRMMVKVEDLANLKAAIDDESYYANGIFLLQNLCLDENDENTWNQDWQFYTFHDANDAKYPDTYEFRYKTTVAKNEDDDTKLPALFTDITVPGELGNEDIKKLENVKIIVTAHAIQADGFDNAEQAWQNF